MVRLLMPLAIFPFSPRQVRGPFSRMLLVLRLCHPGGQVAPACYSNVITLRADIPALWLLGRVYAGKVAQRSRWWGRGPVSSSLRPGGSPGPLPFRAVLHESPVTQHLRGAPTSGQTRKRVSGCQAG